MLIYIPIRLPSLANLRIHWRKLLRIKKEQKEATREALSLLKNRVEELKVPLTIQIKRIGPKKLDDDNLASSCKYVRDEIARFIGIDDGDSSLTWVYKQSIGVYAVEVWISSGH